MRDKRFIAEHRGGSLKKDQHEQLMIWACDCVEHILPLLAGIADKRILNALAVGRAWAAGRASVGDARKASVAAHAAAREAEDPVAVAIARAAGHAVATAHMADHALGPALYGLKAVKMAGRSVEEERNWQNAQLQEEIRELVIQFRNIKERSFKMDR